MQSYLADETANLISAFLDANGGQALPLPSNAVPATNAADDWLFPRGGAMLFQFD